MLTHALEHMLCNIICMCDFTYREMFYDALQYCFRRRKNADSNIEDIYDGSQYKKLFQPGGILSNPNNISFKLNTDGVSVFSSSGKDIWPIFLQINELPPSMR